MAKQIKRTDIVEKDIFKNLIDSADDSITKLKAMNDEFIKMAKTIKNSMNSTKFATTKELNEFIKSTKTATSLSKEQAKVMQELEKANSLKAKAEAELIKVEKEQLRLQDQQIKSARIKQTDDEKQIKINNRIQKSIDDENNAYKRLEKNTRELKNQSKQLGAELRELELNGKRNTKEFNDTAKAFRNVTEQARNGDVALKKLDSQVGDNFRNVGNYEGAINKLGKGLGMLGLAFGVGDVIQGAGRTILDFDQSLADLKSITGLKEGSKELENLKENSIQLGKEVEGGAKNVIEAYKLIGSAKPELLANAEGLNAVTESAIKLSHASGMDLPASATALTDALNQFGAPAEDAGKFINVLANGALFGAAEIPQVTDALLKFGAVAKTSNVSIQESTALIEMLASKGLKGAEAGTALRNVMLKLSAPDALPKEAKEMLSDLGIDMKKLADTSVPFADRLKALSPILKDETAQIKVFGVENVVTAKNLLMNIDGIKQLTKDMDTKGTVDKQAIDRTKTLNQAIIELKGAWDEIVLSFSSGTGASSILVETLSFIARNMGTILNVATKLALGYGALIVVKKAMVLLNKLEGKSFADIGNALKGIGPFLKEAMTGTKKLGDTQVEAGKSAKAFGTAMKTIGFAIAIEVIIQLAKAFYDVASGAEDARVQAELLNKELDNAEKFTSQVNEQIDAKSKKQLQALEMKRADLKLTEAQFIAEKKGIIETAMLRAKFEIQSSIADTKRSKASYDASIKKNGKIENEILYSKEGIRQKLDYASMQGSTKEVTEFTKKYNSLKDELHSLTIEEKNLKNSTEEETKSRTKSTKATSKHTAEVKELETKFKDINEIISEQIKLLNELDNIYRNRAIDLKTDEVQTEFDKQLALAEKTGEANLDVLNKLLQEESELKKAQLTENLKFKIDELQREFEELVASKKKELELERTTLLAQKGLTQKQKDEINANYIVKQGELDKQLEKSKEDTELKKKILTEQATDDVLKLEKDKTAKIKGYEKEIANAKKKNSDEVTEKEKKDDADKLDKTKKMYEEMNKIAKMSADFFIKQSQKKVEQIDAEINALGVQKQFLEQLAVNGNITAEKSLAQNEKLTAEANKKKAQELKKQERIKLAETVFTSYTANVEKGEKNAIVKTISDISVLTAFINSLPTFYTGTERTVAESLGKPQLSGRDGHIVRVDGSEKILNPELSKMTGNMTTMEIAKLSEDKLRGRLMYKNDGVLSINSINNDKLISKFDELNNTIVNKPEVNIELGEIVGGVMHIIESSKKANTTIRNIRRFS